MFCTYLNDETLEKSNIKLGKLSKVERQIASSGDSVYLHLKLDI